MHAIAEPQEKLNIWRMREKNAVKYKPCYCIAMKKNAQKNRDI